MKPTTPVKPNPWPALSLIFFSFFLAWIFWQNGQKNRPVSEPELPVLGTVPDFSLTDQTGKAFSLAELQGEVWVADFIFTRCAGICPLMTGKMKSLQEKIGVHPGIHLVSFSVDPAYDTPEVLTRYAEKFKIGPRWVFLTGDKETLFKLSSGHFHLGVEDIPAGEREAVDQPVRHSSKFALIDQKARIRGYYDSESGDVNKLAEDALKLASEAM